MLRIWLQAAPCSRVALSRSPSLSLRSRPYNIASYIPQFSPQRPTSSVRHLSSSIARRRPDESNSSKAEAKPSEEPVRRKGVLARVLPSSMIPPENSAGGLRKLISLMKPERKTLLIAVGLVNNHKKSFINCILICTLLMACIYHGSSQFRPVSLCLSRLPLAD